MGKSLDQGSCGTGTSLSNHQYYGKVHLGHPVPELYQEPRTIVGKDSSHYVTCRQEVLGPLPPVGEPTPCLFTAVYAYEINGWQGLQDTELLMLRTKP